MLKAFLLFNEHQHKHVDIVKNVLVSTIYKFNSHTHTPDITFRNHFSNNQFQFYKREASFFL
jgi:hypothetical protein